MEYTKVPSFACCISSWSAPPLPSASVLHYDLNRISIKRNILYFPNLILLTICSRPLPQITLLLRKTPTWGVLQIHRMTCLRNTQKLFGIGCMDTTGYMTNMSWKKFSITITGIILTQYALILGFQEKRYCHDLVQNATWFLKLQSGSRNTISPRHNQKTEIRRIYILWRGVHENDIKSNTSSIQSSCNNQLAPLSPFAAMLIRHHHQSSQQAPGSFSPPAQWCPSMTYTFSAFAALSTVLPCNAPLFRFRFAPHWSIRVNTTCELHGDDLYGPGRTLTTTVTPSLPKTVPLSQVRSARWTPKIDWSLLDRKTPRWSEPWQTHFRQNTPRKTKSKGNSNGILRANKPSTRLFRFRCDANQLIYYVPYAEGWCHNPIYEYQLNEGNKCDRRKHNSIYVSTRPLFDVRTERDWWTWRGLVFSKVHLSCKHFWLYYVERHVVSGKFVGYWRRPNLSE